MEERKTESRTDAGEAAEMTFWDHLDVLRGSLFRMLGAVLVAFIAVFAFLPKVFDRFILGATSSDFFLYKWFAALGSLPFTPDFADESFHVDIININVASQFMTHMRASFWIGLVLVFPYVMYELWKFVRPALLPAEKRNTGVAFVFGTGMFYLGCAVGYCIVFPLTFRFLTGYTLGGDIENQINLDSYMGMFLMLIFVMGVVFEMPLLAWLLSQFGLIGRGFLKQYRKHAVVILMILAAIITPSGDPFTLMVVFLPLYLLYEFSILVVKR